MFCITFGIFCFCRIGRYVICVCLCIYNIHWSMLPFSRLDLYLSLSSICSCHPSIHSMMKSFTLSLVCFCCTHVCVCVFLYLYLYLQLTSTNALAIVCFPCKEIWAQICVFQYLSAADILPQFFRRYILGGGKTTCQKKSQRSFHIQIWIRKNQIELRDSNVAKKLLKFSLFLRKLERQATLSCVIWSLQHESRLQNICPNLGIYKWEENSGLVSI